MVRQMTNLDEEAERRKKANAPNYVPLPIPGVPPYSETSDGQPSDVQTKKRKENPITKLYDVQARNHLDAEIAHNNLSGYIPPNYNKLRNHLARKRIRTSRYAFGTNKSYVEGERVTIVSDGWSDPQRRPLINFMATSESGPIFIKSVNCFGEVKDKYFIADLMEEVIEEVGPMNVVQVITDNASNCKGAGELIEINAGEKLHYESFYETSNFNRFSSLKLIAVADTRFASVVVMLKRFKLLRRSLEAMVISEEWGGYKEDDQGLTDDDDDDYSEFFEVVHRIIVARWTKSNTPLNCLAHSLNPRFYSEAWLEENPNRVPPHRDTEISEGRVSCFRRLFPDNADFARAMDEYTMFSYKYLGQPTSSSCCERNWSIYSFIHSLRRNRLNPKRAENLVKIHTNLRLLSRNTNEYTAGKTKLWDVGGDQFDVMDDGNDENAFLEFADLSLDEPDLESVFFP
ncbi:uncharacterized protein LOC125494770 [Beta vulgaris subsp. vulgaris]|uniref:uncharacterized protein LOC125494770 n=1 Tax=Beta vulgaris subsp. vulgaris TaxID=3555 RepID=UPI0025467EE6|nr:uncharacterized protein LOC125494770 [Beta vulgaris subsp. vulgaris]